VVVAGCVVIAILLFVFVRQRRAHQRRKEQEHDNSMFGHTLSFDSHFTANTNIINDPLIIAHRIPFKDVKVANCINKGGFGLVYSGVYNRRRVAIKRIRPDLCSDMKHVEAFMKEICLISTLEHPRIVEFIGVAWDTLRNLSAVTEYMERGDLREVLHSFQLRSTPLTWDAHKTRISLHIAEALMYLHSLNPKLIHRDLKSKNVLLNTDMDAKLSDFGVSRERHFEETHMTAGIGTSFWIAPEVLLGKDYDERADIFSFGVVLSEIDTEDYPYWNAKNPPQGGKVEETAILRMVASGELVPDFSDKCPPSVHTIAMQCLHVDPKERPTAAELVYMLKQLMPTNGSVSSNASGSSSQRSFS
jgi:serine/threonine protein kinase